MYTLKLPLVVLVALCALALGMAFRAWWLPAPLPALAPAGAPQPGTAGAADAIWRTTLPDPDGTMQAVSQWKGRVLVVNFWGTWCPPCIEEIPHFIRLQERYREQGVVFVGIAIDRVEPVQRFIRQFGVNYPVLIGDVDTFGLARAAGNRVDALPYTVVLDRNGAVVSTKSGIYREADLDAVLRELI